MLDHGDVSWCGIAGGKKKRPSRAVEASFVRLSVMRQQSTVVSLMVVSSVTPKIPGAH
jgi:hypothetical protein